MRNVSKIMMINMLFFAGIIVPISAEEIEGQLSTAVLTKYNLPLEGVEFTIYDESNEIVGTMITDEQGEARSDVLPGGDYKVVETNVPPGYTVNDDVYTISLIHPDAIEDINNGEAIINEKAKSIVYGQVAGKLTDQDGNGLASSEFVAYDEEGNPVSVMTTDDDGDFLSDDLVTGKYTVKQTASLDGYYSDINSYEVEITNPGQIVEINNDEPIINNQISTTDTGNICLKVIDEANNPISGVEFTLYNDKSIKVDSANSNDFGVVYFPEVLLGDYTLRETKELDNYYLDKTIYQANLVGKNQNLIINDGVALVNYAIEGREDKTTTGDKTGITKQYATCEDAFKGIVTKPEEMTEEQKEEVKELTSEDAAESTNEDLEANSEQGINVDEKSEIDPKATTSDSNTETNESIKDVVNNLITFIKNIFK